MNAEDARRLMLLDDTELSSARQALLVPEQGPEQQAEIIAELAGMHRRQINRKIAEAAKSATRITHDYSEFISRKYYSDEEIETITGAADAIAERIVEDLQADGFVVEVQDVDIVDFAGATDSTPDFYRTTISIDWQQA